MKNIIKECDCQLAFSMCLCSCVNRRSL